jgi:uncharacterized protein (TIGR00288 family)
MAGPFQPLRLLLPASDILLPPGASHFIQGTGLPQQERVNIAVFIDFDNIEIGVRTTLNEHFDIGTILEALKERGEVVTKIAYADWTRAGEYSRALTQHAIRLVQRNLTPGGDKNGADINLALDALELAFTHPHINAYVIVGGDSDFLSLVEKLKQYDKKVFVVGGRAFTSVILQRNCHEFIAYENLVRKPAVRGGRPIAAAAPSPIAQAVPIVRRALKILADREVSPQTGLLKSTLLQLDSTFSERNYGASSFLDFVEKLAKAGLVQLKHAGRSVMVELNEGFRDDGDQASGDGRTMPAPAASTAPEQAGDTAEGVRLAGQALAAAANARWPMYLRNIKQILRAGGFDERRYGFTGLIELLRACQKQGLIRLERDRRGGLRVFQGAALTADAPRADEGAAAIIDVDVVEQAPTAPQAPGDEPATFDAEPFEPEAVEPQPVAVVDTTAELLGRAKPKPRRRRSTHGDVESGLEPRAGRAGGAAARRAVRKPGALTRKASRPSKSSSDGRSERDTAE